MSAAIVRLEEIEGVHFWLLKVDDQRRTYLLYFGFQVGKGLPGSCRLERK
jgi:hypothetical protein